MSTEILTPNTRINRYSDFRLVITMTKDGEAYVPAQFRFIFYVEDWDDCHGRYTASCIKGITTNCAVEDSSITVFFNSPNFNLGELKCRFYDITDNGNFADGTLDTCTPVTLPVEIVSGAGDAEVVNISVQYAGSGSIDIDTSDFMTKSTYTYPIDQLNPRIAGKIQYWAIPDQVVDYIDGIGDAHIATTGTIYGAANGSIYMAKRSGEQLLYSAEDRVIFNKEDGHLYTYDGEAWAQVGGSSSGGEGTVTAVKMNNGTPIEPDEDGVVNLGTVIKQHQDISGKANSADLATVATSGSYNDLTDKPTIPEGADLTGYATEQYVNTAIAGLVDSSPETLDTLNELAAALGDDPTFATTMATALGNKVDKESGKSLMTDAERTKLAGIAAGAEVNVNADWNAASGDAQILNKPNLATVATSGSYNDLSNKPTIPAAQVQSDWNATTGMGTILNKPTIPSKTSDLTNDSGFTSNAGTITGITMNGASKGTSGVVDLGTVITSHQDISGKANASDVYTKTQTDTLLAGKQDTLTFDDAPTANSNNPVKSGGIKTYVDGKVSITGMTTSQDGTFTIAQSDGNSFTVDLNHTHPQYLKYQLLADEAAYNALSTKDSGTLYLIPES